MPARVLFVSKPIVPPFHDGTQCIVRDLATHLSRVRASCMATALAPPLHHIDGSEVPLEPVYSEAGAFAPSLAQNLRAAAWLALKARADVWHYVFAPNRRASTMGRWLVRMRRPRVVQTIASPPRSFDGIEKLLFGDVVVAQSRWTAQQIAAAYQRAGIPDGQQRRVVVIPPPLAPLVARSGDGHRALRRSLAIGDEAPLFVYPGDLEHSAGARNVANCVGALRRLLPEAVVVFAYRAKTPGAEPAAEQLRRDLPGEAVRLVRELPDVLDLISGCSAVLFPVDDLWGKVDIPIVLLEAMQLGVPVVALDRGPLKDLSSVHFVPEADAEALARAAALAVQSSAQRAEQVAAQRATIRNRFAAPVVARAYEELYLSLLADGRG